MVRKEADSGYGLIEKTKINRGGCEMNKKKLRDRT